MSISTLENPQTASNTAVVKREDQGITRWNVWDEMKKMRREMDELFGRAFNYDGLPGFPNLELGNLPTFEPAVDIYETDNEIRATASVPGYTTADIKVEATPDWITVRGERSSKVEEKAVAHRRNGVSEASQFSFTFSAPAQVDPKNISAKLENGTLQLTMPKTAPAQKAIVVPVLAVP